MSQSRVQKYLLSLNLLIYFCKVTGGYQLVAPANRSQRDTAHFRVGRNGSQLISSWIAKRGKRLQPTCWWVAKNRDRVATHLAITHRLLHIFHSTTFWLRHIYHAATHRLPHVYHAVTHRLLHIYHVATQQICASTMPQPVMQHGSHSLSIVHVRISQVEEAG